jgi:hypothetical protein
MDIDFATDFSDGQFRISLTENPAMVSGNRALVNRFEITFLTKQRQFSYDGGVVIDNYGGDAGKFISKPQVLSDTQSIAASLTVAIQQTVSSMKKDQSPSTMPTERIANAELISVDVINGIITASIQIFPEEVESYEALKFNLPIVRR